MKPILPKIRVSLTDRCQLSCRFCRGEGSTMENFQPQGLQDTIETAQLKSVLSAYLAVGGTCVQFTGGEPTLRRDLCDLVRFVADAGGVPEINTNGIALTKTRLRELREAGLGIVKVSLPALSRQRYAETTGVDCFQRVLDNIHVATEVLPVRVNTVACQSTQDLIIPGITLLHEMGLRQLLILELLYYPHVQGAKAYFESEYVDIVNALVPTLERELGGSLEHFPVPSKFETSLARIRSTKLDGFQLIIKTSTPSHRLSECRTCPDMCQEGVYELRLSTGGYLNFCNVPNQFGSEVGNITDRARLQQLFEGYARRLEHCGRGSFEEFRAIRGLWQAPPAPATAGVPKNDAVSA